MHPHRWILPAALLLLAGCTTGTPGSVRPAAAAPAAAAPAASSAIQDGRSFETAIVVKADDETKGVAAEYAWIRAHIPGARPAGQALLQHEGRPYDVIHVALADGSTREVFFDISSFFGKL